MKMLHEKIANILIILFQFFFAFIISFTLFMISSIVNYKGGFDNFIAIAIFHPLIAFVVCLFTIAACFIVGLPLRLIKPLNNWLKSHILISISGLVGGIVLMAIAYLPSLRDSVHSEQGQLTEIPNQALSMIGFFTVTFFSLHTFPPRPIILLVNRMILIFNIP